MPLCGASWPYGRQSPPYSLVSGWQLNSYNPHKFSKHRGSVFSFGCADSTTSDGRRGSNLYEVNTWLWNFGRGKPRLGGLTVDKTAMRKKTVKKDQAKRSKETSRLQREDGAWSNEVFCFLYQYVLVHTCMYLFCTWDNLNMSTFEIWLRQIVLNA